MVACEGGDPEATCDSFLLLSSVEESNLLREGDLKGFGIIMESSIADL